MDTILRRICQNISVYQTFKVMPQKEVRAKLTPMGRRPPSTPCGAGTNKRVDGRPAAAMTCNGRCLHCIFIIGHERTTEFHGEARGPRSGKKLASDSAPDSLVAPGNFLALRADRNIACFCAS